MGFPARSGPGDECPHQTAGGLRGHGRRGGGARRRVEQTARVRAGEGAGPGAGPAVAPRPGDRPPVAGHCPPRRPCRDCTRPPTTPGARSGPTAQRRWCSATTWSRCSLAPTSSSTRSSSAPRARRPWPAGSAGAGRRGALPGRRAAAARGPLRAVERRSRARRCGLLRLEPAAAGRPVGGGPGGGRRRRAGPPGDRPRRTSTGATTGRRCGSWSAWTRPFAGSWAPRPARTCRSCAARCWRRCRRGRSSRRPAARRGTRLVGRRDAGDQVRARLDRADEGRGSTLLVTGPPGVGKSAVLEMATALARQRGWRTGRGTASAVEGPWPYAPVLEALGDLCRQHPTLLDGLGDIFRDEVERALSGRDVAWSGETAHQRLFLAAAELLQAGGRRSRRTARGGRHPRGGPGVAAAAALPRPVRCGGAGAPAAGAPPGHRRRDARGPAAAWWPAVSAACSSCGHWTSRPPTGSLHSGSLRWTSATLQRIWAVSARPAVHRAGDGPRRRDGQPADGRLRAAASRSSGRSSGSRSSARRSPPTSCWPWRGSRRSWPTGTSTPPSARWWWSPTTPGYRFRHALVRDALLDGHAAQEQTAARVQVAEQLAALGAAPARVAHQLLAAGPARARHTLRDPGGGDRRRAGRLPRCARPWWTRCWGTRPGRTGAA